MASVRSGTRARRSAVRSAGSAITRSTGSSAPIAANAAALPKRSTSTGAASADRERGHRRSLEHAEHAREDIGRGEALQERAPGDVHEAATRAPRDDEREDRRRAGYGAREHEAEPPSGDAEREPAREPGAPGEAAGPRRAEHAAEAECRVD